MRSFLILAPLALLAACGGGSEGNSAAPAAPVEGAAPPAGQQWSQVVSETPEGGYRMGNPNAPVKLVEYGSRTCPACGAFAREGFEPLTKLVETGKVSFEFRDFLIHGAPDVASGVLGRCGGPGTFFPLLEQMYANQAATLDKLQATPPEFQTRIQNLAPAQQVAAFAEQAGYIDFVKQRGIPEAQARQCLADMNTIQKLVGVTEKATEVQGTPTFLINGEKAEGAVSWAQVEAALKKAGA
ncbi:protein-disulfide isomerase [Sphingomonas spermidinifaciens]|uniref:Protein-disulfide isomerase n=1 Tax=Sphingomonas spermidinifaciens TaxID=1141889 RepID=A0A2A4B8B0_9SPHN|nr:thioredoxin domain-containing protein [Sphingomonas spermidinifaciens]PCD04165.1 protein-disulfide isomerase [Sphingomonas spermidinifaciens]